MKERYLTSPAIFWRSHPLASHRSDWGRCPKFEQAWSLVRYCCSPHTRRYVGRHAVQPVSLHFRLTLLSHQTHNRVDHQEGCGTRQQGRRRSYPLHSSGEFWYTKQKTMFLHETTPWKSIGLNLNILPHQDNKFYLQKILGLNSSPEPWWVAQWRWEFPHEILTTISSRSSGTATGQFVLGRLDDGVDDAGSMVIQRWQLEVGVEDWMCMKRRCLDDLRVVLWVLLLSISLKAHSLDRWIFDLWALWFVVYLLSAHLAGSCVEFLNTYLPTHNS